MADGPRSAVARRARVHPSWVVASVVALLAGVVTLAAVPATSGAATPRAATPRAATVAGVTWAELYPVASPLGRQGSPGSMAYDPATGQVVYFGGFTTESSGTSDTWTWSGGDWHEAATTAAPSPREGAAMAYDPATEQLLLFGGRGVSGPP